MSDLHTEYYNEVGCKYGLQRGIPYDELSPEERRGRRHKALGQRFRMIWDSNKSLSQELKVKDTVILEKDAKIKSLNAKVTTLTEEVLDSLVTNGKNSLRSFALTDRIDFNEQEAKSIYYSIMAIAQKFDFDLCTKNGVSSAVSKFLEGISWKGCTNFRMECVTNWTKLFAENNNIYDSHVIDNFISFIDYMSCNAKTNVTTVGSNGCADQLTNWDGTQKIGLGALPKKKRGMS